MTQTPEDTPQLDPVSGPVPSLYGVLDLPPWPEDLIVRTLIAHGEWGAAEVDVLAPVVPDVPGGAVLWDLGAFLGTFSLGLARLAPLSRVLAVEANPALAPYLTRNLTRNLPCPAQVLSAGVGGQDGWLVPRARGDHDTNHGAQDYDLIAAGESDSDPDNPPDTPPGSAIPCHTLAALRAEYGDYDMLKLDLEGLEHSVLESDRAYLTARQPVIWSECNESRDSLKLFKLLTDLGYATTYLAFPAFRRANFNKATDLIYPLAYEAGLLSAPPERLAQLTGQVAGEDILMRPLTSPMDLRRALYDTPRWGQRDWAEMSRPELIARLGRLSKGQPLKDFLLP